LDDPTHSPNGLSGRQLARLQEHVRRGQLQPPDRLLQAAYAHLEDVRVAQIEKPELDTQLPEVICQVLGRIVADWDQFSPAEQSWFRGALWYFTKSDDDCHDLQHGGFCDDVEVLNACLCFAHRNELVIPLDRKAQ